MSESKMRLTLGLILIVIGMITGVVFFVATNRNNLPWGLTALLAAMSSSVFAAAAMVLFIPERFYPDREFLEKTGERGFFDLVATQIVRLGRCPVCGRRLKSPENGDMLVHQCPSLKAVPENYGTGERNSPEEPWLAAGHRGALAKFRDQIVGRHSHHKWRFVAYEPKPRKGSP